VHRSFLSNRNFTAEGERENSEESFTELGIEESAERKAVSTIFPCRPRFLQAGNLTVLHFVFALRHGFKWLKAQPGRLGKGTTSEVAGNPDSGSGRARVPLVP
jgi:hypothetical protein